MKIVAALAYVGIGVALHALFVGLQFDWHSVWTWAWLVAWPVLVGFWFVLALVVVGLAVFAWELATGRV